MLQNATFRAAAEREKVRRELLCPPPVAMKAIAAIPLDQIRQKIEALSAEREAGNPEADGLLDKVRVPTYVNYTLRCEIDKTKGL